MKHYTVAEISRTTTIPESTLRYRTKLFKKYIPVIGKGRKKRFTQDSLNRFVFINDCFSEGMDTENILLAMEKKYGPEITIETTQLKKDSVLLTTKNNSKFDIELLSPILKVIENQEIIIQELRAQNKVLLPQAKKGFLGRIFG